MGRMYPVNEHFFETIDTEEKAYFLGFMFADGCVHRSRKNYWRISITQHKRDKHIIERFRVALNSSHPITVKNEIYVEFRIGSKKLAMDLIKHGCIERKSLLLKFPTTVPNHLLVHFIRGYSDGDGCIYWGHLEKHPNLIKCYWSLVGTENFLQGILDILENELGIKTRLYKVRNVQETMISSNPNFRKCLEWLYANADETLYLQRKYDKFKEWKEKREKVDARKKAIRRPEVCGCDARHEARGLCGTHYKQLRRYEKKELEKTQKKGDKKCNQ